MTQTDLVKLNFEEIRRRSIMLWRGLPEAYYGWKPDPGAMSAIDLVRHVLGADFGWNIIINQGDVFSERSPWADKPYTTVEEELDFAEPHRQRFLESVSNFSDIELATVDIVHPGNGKRKKLGDYLLRIGYHESVHAGQFLSYLRGMGVERPLIWD